MNRKSPGKSSQPARQRRKQAAEHPEAASQKPENLEQDLWIADKPSRPEEAPSFSQAAKLPPAQHDSRLLHLADVALGQHKPDPFRRRSRSKVLGGN
jgi:hypothetical protein